MIAQHAFNTTWWNGPVGIVANPLVLQRAAVADVAAAAERFEWVELRGLADSGLDPAALLARGFFAADSQVRFRIGLRPLQPTPSLARLEVRFADEQPFVVGAQDIMSFGSERFSALPGVDEARIRERYALWSDLLIAECPQRCLQVLLGGQVQGYFLARQGAMGLNLTLAVLNPAASVTGLHLYHKALLAYAGRGERVGHASFSVTNTAVLNIYTSLGARFLTPELFYLRLKAPRGG